MQGFNNLNSHTLRRVKVFFFRFIFFILPRLLQFCNTADTFFPHSHSTRLIIRTSVVRFKVARSICERQTAAIINN
jgi:hypothetical protein